MTLVVFGIDALDPDDDLTTVFDGRELKAIGGPNYVVDADSEDCEHNSAERLASCSRVIHVA